MEATVGTTSAKLGRRSEHGTLWVRRHRPFSKQTAIVIFVPRHAVTCDYRSRLAVLVGGK